MKAKKPVKIYLLLLTAIFLLNSCGYIEESDLVGNTASNTDWWNVNWANRRKLIFDNSAQSENLTNFPVLIKLNSTRIDYAKTQDSTGEDIRFIDTDGTVLKHEVEQWNESGDSFIWVKIPQIDGSSTTDYIWMYYGNNGAGDGQDKNNVWDSNFLGVWHLSETSGTVNDSTSNNALTNDGAVPDAPGQIGRSYSFGGDGDNLESTSYTYTLTTQYSLEIWFKYSGAGTGSPRILEISKIGDANSHCLAPDLDGSLRAWTECDNGNRVAGIDDPTNYNDGQWHYMVYTYSSPNGILYVDGNVTDTASGACSNIDDGAFFILGAVSDAGTLAHTDHEFDGDIDEARVSNIARSADWVTAQNKSMRDNSFISFGSEE